MSNKYNDPVVWYDGKKFYGSQEAASMCLADMITLKPLYSAPPKREPLSEDEAWKIFSEVGTLNKTGGQIMHEFANAVLERTAGIRGQS